MNTIEKIAVLNLLGVTGEGPNCPVVEAIAERLSDETAQLMLVAAGTKLRKQQEKLKALIASASRPTQAQGLHSGTEESKVEGDPIALFRGLLSDMIGPQGRKFIDSAFDAIIGKKP